MPNVMSYSDTTPAGGAALELEPRDTRAWAEALQFAAASPEGLAQWRAKARARAAVFSWARTAALTRAVYARAAALFT
jgi:glycosyltransferase involved in cell wall biosynthesis